jgi:hypothetical protein
MSNNNFYPEVLEFGKQNNETNDADKLVDLIKEHLVGTSRNADKLLNLLQTYKEALNKDLEPLSGEAGASASSSSDSSGSGDDTGNKGGDEQSGGGDEFGISGDDLNLNL